VLALRVLQLSLGFLLPVLLESSHHAVPAREVRVAGHAGRSDLSACQEGCQAVCENAIQRLRSATMTSADASSLPSNLLRTQTPS
jgi:predicted nucleic acid-binding Zn ribbon protein